MSEAATTHDSAPPAARSEWIWSPAFDLVVGCGAWSLPLLGVVVLAGASRNAAIALAFYALSIVCNYPHYMATLYRAYRTRAEFTKYKLFTLHITAILVATAVFVHWSPGWAPLFFTIYVTWSPWHYTGQNFGIAMMFARRGGASPTRADRNWLYTAFAASYALIFLALHTGASDEPYVLSLGLPEGFSRGASALCLVVFAVAAARAVWRLVGQAGVRAMTPPLVVLSTQFLWFVLPTIVINWFGYKLERTSYSVGALAFMHCAQYLWITSFYARREAEERHERWRPWVYATALVAGGIALFIPGPWIVSYALHYDFTATFLIFGALVNIHHFVVDGAIWKLRDSRVAGLLLGSDADTINDRPWTASLPGLVRGGAVVAVVALVCLAAVDVARFAFAGDRSELRSLQRALALNPFDVPVRTAIARVQAERGEVGAAIVTLKEAVAIDPYDVAADRALAKLLLESGRYEEAYQHHKTMYGKVPADVDTLVNYGTLAARFGHDSDAIEVLQRALAMDERQPLAHLELAEALARSNRTAEAIPHFERYIGLVAERPDAIADLESFAGVLIDTGDAYVVEKKASQAATYYARAVDFAEQGGKPAIEGTAYARLAAVLDAAGKTQDAVDAYRRAIDRSAVAGDKAAAAGAWYNYSQLIAKHGAPPRLVVACLLAAREGSASDPGPQFDAANAALAKYEDRLPGISTATQKELPKALDDARAFTPAP